MPEWQTYEKASAMDTKTTPKYGLEHVTKIRQIIDSIGTINPLN